MVKVLLQAGVSVDMKANDGDTPLLVAASNGNLDCIVCLLDAGASVDLQGDFGKTPLMYAAALDHLPVVECLVEAVSIGYV